jgi:hypothetical protein
MGLNFIMLPFLLLINLFSTEIVACHSIMPVSVTHCVVTYIIAIQRILHQTDMHPPPAGLLGLILCYNKATEDTNKQKT